MNRMVGRMSEIHRFLSLSRKSLGKLSSFQAEGFEQRQCDIPLSWGGDKERAIPVGERNWRKLRSGHFVGTAGSSLESTYVL